MNCRTRDGLSITQLGERLDLTVRRGVTVGPYRHTMRKSDGTLYDLTGHTVTGQVRGPDDTLVAEFTINMPSPVDGWYEFSIASDELLTVPPGTYSYDTEMRMPDDTVVPLYYGMFNLKPEVTK